MWFNTSIKLSDLRSSYKRRGRKENATLSFVICAWTSLQLQVNARLLLVEFVDRVDPDQSEEKYITGEKYRITLIIYISRIYLSIIITRIRKMITIL